MSQSKKILIIDDEQASISPAFNLANALYFQNELEFVYKPRSQDVNYERLKDEFSIVIVDITLAARSEMDGYGVLNKIISNGLFPLSRLFILTGNSQIKSELEKRGINTSIKVVQKPVTFSELQPILSECLE